MGWETSAKIGRWGGYRVIKGAEKICMFVTVMSPGFSVDCISHYNEKCVSCSRHYNIIVPVYLNSSTCVLPIHRSGHKQYMKC